MGKGVGVGWDGANTTHNLRGQFATVVSISVVSNKDMKVLSKLWPSRSTPNI